MSKFCQLKKTKNKTPHTDCKSAEVRYRPINICLFIDPQSKKDAAQRPLTPTYDMAGRHNHRKHAPYYRLQEHHVSCPEPFLIIFSTHDLIIRPNLITPSSFSILFSFTTLIISCFVFFILPCLCDFPYESTPAWFPQTLFQWSPFTLTNSPPTHTHSCRHSQHMKAEEGCHCCYSQHLDYP